MKIIVLDGYPLNPGGDYTDLAISLYCPRSDSNAEFIDSALISKTKDDVIIINTIGLIIFTS